MQIIMAVIWRICARKLIIDRSIFLDTWFVGLIELKYIEFMAEDVKGKLTFDLG